FAAMGVLALNVPEAHGGLAAEGGNPLDTLVVMRELGRGLVVEPLWMSAVVCANAIALAGSDAQQSALLPGLADGSSVFALAALEPQGRYDPLHVDTTAVAVGDTYRLTGRKSVVLHGAQATHLLVSARVSGDVNAADGIALFVVERGATGLRTLDFATVDGLRAANVTLEGVTVPASAMLADGKRGAAVLERTLELASAALCAEALGIVEALTDTTNDYLKTRKQFGVPIGKFQALQHRVADMLVCVEQVRAMAYLAAVRVSLDDAVARRSAITAARVAIAEAGRFVTRNAVQLHGGMGVTDELIVSHYVKRLTMLNQTFGDYDYHLARYAEAMV
ncbi:MAG: acyl-CoA dehydrogenase family protein, partial [Betaproteobacteria bacterium]